MKKIGKAAVILITGMLLGWLLFGSASPDQPTNMDEHIEESHTNEQGEILYTCSMHPSVREKEPGNCPICGMELIPVSSSGEAKEESHYELTMTEAAMKLAEVQTSTVVMDTAINRIRMPGRIAVNERRIANISAQFPGRVEELYINFTGQKVDKGEKLASIYSPELITAQKELLEAQKYKKSNPELYKSARRKLELWELPESTISDVVQSGEIKTTVDIVSPVDGYVTKRNISREDYVNTGSLMYNIADLSNVWVQFDAFESDLMGLETGDRVRYTVEAYPGEFFEGRITYIDPVLDPKSRTISVRAEANNPNLALKPGMLAEGVVSSVIYGGNEQILVPKTAVLWTGERSVVYVRKPNTNRPTFEFREVVLGPRVGEQYVIKSGVKAGEEVVTHGNFKIDSAAQLAGKASMMNRETSGRKSPGMPGMPGMKMDGKEKEERSTLMKNANTSSTAKVASKTVQEINLDTLNVPESFIKELSHLTEAYIDIKNSLVDDNLNSAISGTKRLQKTLSNIDENLLKNKTQNTIWMQQRDALHNHIEAIQKAADLASFRTDFVQLSETLSKTLRLFGINQKLYIQYCPMALSGKGAHWLSTQKEIANPYMGQMMPTCGETTRILESKGDKEIQS